MEAKLAKRLLGAADDERQRLYGVVYDQIYSMHLEREPDVLDFGATVQQIPTLVAQTEQGDHVLEIGCGTGLLAIALRDAGRHVTAVDVSQVALDHAARRAGSVDGLKLQHVTGTALPLPDSTFEFAYSVEVVEHLHERDAREHFEEVARVLKRGARYWFMTPSRYASRKTAERFGVPAEADADADVHLKEWTHHELLPLLKAAGFARVAVPLGHSTPNVQLAVPGLLAAVAERIPGLPPSKIGRVLGLSQCIVRASAR